MRELTIAIIAALFLLMDAVGAADYAAQKDIVDTAVADGNFTTLVEALQIAGLEDTLKGPGPFTIFAPSDEAFSKLSSGSSDATGELDILMENESELARILNYHLVSGALMSTDLKDGMPVKTMEGSDLVIRISDGAVMVNGARVITSDIKASNGVIHMIDTLLVPPTLAGAVSAGTETF